MYIWTTLYVASRFIESAVRVFRLIVSSPTYSWQLATLVALRILKILFKRCHPSHPPLSTSPCLPPQSIWRVPSNESSDIKWKRLSIPSISEYKMLLCNPKWVQMWQTSATFVRQRQASSIYRDICIYVYITHYMCAYIYRKLYNCQLNHLTDPWDTFYVGAEKVIHINSQIYYKIQILKPIGIYLLKL